MSEELEDEVSESEELLELADKRLDPAAFEPPLSKKRMFLCNNNGEGRCPEPSDVAVLNKYTNLTRTKGTACLCT